MFSNDKLEYIGRVIKLSATYSVFGSLAVNSEYMENR